MCRSQGGADRRGVQIIEGCRSQRVQSIEGVQIAEGADRIWCL